MNCGRCGSSNTSEVHKAEFGGRGVNIKVQCHDCQKHSYAYSPVPVARKEELRGSMGELDEIIQRAARSCEEHGAFVDGDTGKEFRVRGYHQLCASSPTLSIHKGPYSPIKEDDYLFLQVKAGKSGGVIEWIPAKNPGVARNPEHKIAESAGAMRTERVMDYLRDSNFLGVLEQVGIDPDDFNIGSYVSHRVLLRGDSDSYIMRYITTCCGKSVHGEIDVEREGALAYPDSYWAEIHNRLVAMFEQMEKVCADIERSRR